MSPTETAERLREGAERVRERLEPTVERIRENAPEYAERGREAIEHAKDVAPDYVERFVESSREAGERVEEYLSDLDVDEETVRTWGPPLLAGIVGFILGLLVGRALARRRSDEGSETKRGLAHAPRSSSRDTPPPTRMPEVAEIVEAGSDGRHN